MERQQITDMRQRLVALAAVSLLALAVFPNPLGLIITSINCCLAGLAIVIGDE